MGSLLAALKQGFAAGLRGPNQRSGQLARVAPEKPVPPQTLPPDTRLDDPLLNLGGGNTWTIGDACMGTAIFGQSGSGKTSGSGKAIATAFLNEGFGGLVLCHKASERALWERYAASCGRAEDLIIFAPGSPWAFNFLAYEWGRGKGGGYTENLVALLEEVASLDGAQGQQGNEAYWSRALKQLLRNAVEVVAAATGTVALADLFRLVSEAPQSAEELHDPAWQAQSACLQLLAQADARAGRGALEAGQVEDLQIANHYWLSEFPRLAERTRSIIVSMFTGMADGFMRSTMRRLFCEGTTVTPEQTHDGKIIVVDLNIAQFGELGRMAQVIWKRLWQQAIERRDVEEHPTPAFLWADEAQGFSTASDAAFQATARSARACTVYLSQNRPNYIEAMGNEHRVDALMGNLATKVFHANAEPTTNQWAADLIARTAQHKASFTRSELEEGRGGITFSEAMDYKLQPEVFTRLAQGGSAGVVRGYWFQSGRAFAPHGETFIPVEFKQ